MIKCASQKEAHFYFYMILSERLFTKHHALKV